MGMDRDPKCDGLGGMKQAGCSILLPGIQDETEGKGIMRDAEEEDQAKVIGNREGKPVPLKGLPRMP